MKLIVIPFEHHAELLSGQWAAEHQISVGISSHETAGHRPVYCIGRPAGRGVVRKGLLQTVQFRLHLRAESIHALAVLGEPVHHITVVGGNALLVALTMADDVLLGQIILLAEVGAQFHSLPIDLPKIHLVGQIIFTDLKADVGIVGAATGMPPSIIPGQRLVGGNGAVLQFADKRVNADLSPTRC